MIVSLNFTPGFISTLHTFGRDLKWNPHIHVLTTEGAAGNFTPWKKFECFPYIMLRNRFQTTLLSLLEKHFGKPAMAQSRISDYDGEYVTFWYDRHEDNQRITERIHAYEFIKRLIIHISDKFIYMLKSHVASFRKQFGNWRCRIILNFKQDPLKCSCGHTFHFDYITNIGYNTS